MKIINYVKQSLRYIPGFIITIGLVSLISCGGGGSGGDGDGGDVDGSLNYTGLTEMAVINSDNAIKLSMGAYFGGPVMEVTTNFRAAVISGDEEKSFLHGGEVLYFLKMVSGLENLSASEDAMPAPRAIVTETETFIGNCGGSATIAVDIDDTSGNFTGTFKFDNYCEYGETASGTINLSGTFDFSADDIANMDMSYSQLTVISSNGSVTMSGTASADYSSSTDLITLNYLIRDNTSDKVHKVDNYAVSILEGLDWIEITNSSGRYYHPDYGYVEVSSAVPFIHHIGEIGPSSGELIIEGDTLTKASLMALTASTFEVSVDTNGDGTFDWSSDTLNWSSSNIAP